MKINKIIKAVDNLAYMIFFIIVISKIGQSGGGILGAALIAMTIIFSVFFGGTCDIVAKMVNNRIRRGFNDNAKKVFSYSIITSVVISGLITLLFYFCGNSIANILFGDSLSGSLLMCVGVFLVVDSLCLNIKGYYLGCGGHIIMFISDIVKDIVLIALSPFVINYFLSYGEKVSALKNDSIMTGLYGAIGVLIVMVASNLIMLIILISGMRGLMKQDSFSFNEVRSKDGFKTFFRSFFPAWLKKLEKNVCPSIVVFVTGIVFVKSNIRIEITRDLVYSDFSKLLFAGFLFVIVALLIFEETAYNYYKPIRMDFKKEDRKSVMNRFTAFAKSGATIIVPGFITLLAFNKPLNKIIFDNNFDDISALFIVGAFVFLFASFDRILCVGLEAVNMNLSVFLGNVVGFIVNLIYVLVISKKGLTLTSAVFGILVYYLLCVIIHGVFALNDIKLKLNDFLAKLIKIAIAALPMLIIDLILARFVTMNYIIIIISVVVSYLIYAIVLTAIRGMNQKDVNSMQGSILYYLFNILASIFHIR